MKAVNLLPHETPSLSRGRRRFDPLLVGGGAVTLAVVAAVAGGFVLEHSHARAEQQQLAAARSALARQQAQQTGSSSAPTLLAAPAVLGEVTSWRQAVENALSTRVPWDRTLAQIGDVVPADVTLSSVNLGPPGAAGATSTPAGAGDSLTLAGVASSHTAVATLLSRLKLVPGLTQVALGTTSVNATTGSVNFQVQAQVSA